MQPVDTNMMADAYELIGLDQANPWLITCDHASNVVPETVNQGSLGLSSHDMARHIAWDIGAAGVTRALSQALEAPAILSRFSRMVIDPNRGEDDPTLIMQIYDGTLIPGNRALTAEDREYRLNTFYRPYHAALAECAARQRNTLLVAVHSFTPTLRGRTARPWHIGILFADDERLSRPFLTRLYAEGDLVVGENEPYAGHLPGDSVDRHGLGPGRPNVLIEIRNDLIQTPGQQVAWATRLAPLLEAARLDANL